MENITFFDFERTIYEERRDVGATMLKSSKIIASHTLKQHRLATSYATQA
jgi:hypothetical protein